MKMSKKLHVDEIGKYLLRECRHVSIEEIKSRYCLYFIPIILGNIFS